MKQIQWLLGIALMSFCTTWMGAQEEAIFNQYINNHYLLNPGATGFYKTDHRVFFNYRSQWAGFPGSPQSYSVNYNGPIGQRLGLGASFFADNVAEFQKLRGQLSFAYSYPIGDVDLSVGLNTELHRTQLSNDVLDDPLFEAGDQLVEDLMNGMSEFDMSMGIYGTINRDKEDPSKGYTFFGASLPGMVRNRIDEIGGEESTSNSPFRNYTAMLGYRFISKDLQTEIEPSVVVRKARTAPVLVDVNLRASLLDSKLITGATYTAGTDGAMGLYLGSRYETLQLMYSYHIYFGEFQQFNNGSHEISLGFFLPQDNKKYDRTQKFRN